jgi:sterol 3beta-glucosyltransferase
LAPPDDWNHERIHVTGYWFLEPSEQWHPPTDLIQFLDSGPPPVYIGFGSMSNRKPEETADLVLRAIRHTGERAIIFSGWAGLQKADLPDSVLMIDNVPHSWLFSRVRAVVHHGGAGTTAAGLRAGVPSVIVPFHGDQPFWAQRVTSLGVGPAPIARSRLTAESLAKALQTAMNDPLMHQRAVALGASIRAEDGIEKAVAIIQQLGG